MNSANRASTIGLQEKGVLIVALTGFGQEEDRRRSFQAGIATTF